MRLSVFVFAFFWTLLSWSQQVTVLIDAGHGGNDPGHLSTYPGIALEKDLNLKIANYLGSYIEKYLGNVKVIYTRQGDQTVSLDERVDLANNQGVDYMLSIHCNGSPDVNIHGTETHIHNFAAKQAFSFARNIEAQFEQRAGRHSRGVKNNDDRAHSIQVLKYTKMTSVLVECGFITNEREANYLQSTYGQEIIASAIFRAFRSQIKMDFPTINFDPNARKDGYVVQIMSSKTPISTSHESFTRLDMPINREKIRTNNPYKFKYWLGPFSSSEEASNALQKAKRNGFPDAILNRL